MLKKEEEKRLAAEARAIFATRLGIARAAVYSDQDRAGAALGLRKRRWGGWEGGRREPPLWLLRKLPEMFHRPLSWFFDLPDERGLSDQEARVISALRSIEDPEFRSWAENTIIGLLEAVPVLPRPRIREAE